MKPVTMNSLFGARKVRTPRVHAMIPQQQSTASKAHHHVKAQAWRMLSTFVPRLATTAANSSACRGLMRPFQASLMTCMIPAPPGQSEGLESYTCLQLCYEETLIKKSEQLHASHLTLACAIEGAACVTSNSGYCCKLKFKTATHSSISSKGRVQALLCMAGIGEGG